MKAIVPWILRFVKLAVALFYLIAGSGWVGCINNTVVRPSGSSSEGEWENSIGSENYSIPDSALGGGSVELLTSDNYGARTVLGGSLGGASESENFGLRAVKPLVEPTE